MKIITRYLAKEVYSSTLAATAILLLIFLTNQLVRFMHSAAYGSLASGAVKLVLLLQLPILSAVILPAALFLGILLAYGRLYADSEMVVLFACGLNPKKLLTTTLTFSAAIMLLVAALSLWINPKVYRYFDHLMSGGANHSLDMIKPKHFTEIAGNSWVFYVDEIASDKKHYSGVFASQVPNSGNKKLAVLTAKSAYQKVDDVGDLYLVLVNGYRYLGNPGQKDFEVIKYGEYGLQIKEEKHSWVGDASSASLTKLWESSDLNSSAELQWRISLPLLALILTLIATPLSKIPSRKGRYAMLAPAILLYIIYANFLFLAKAWIKKGVIAPIIGMWWVHVLMLGFAIFLIIKQSGGKFVGFKSRVQS